MALTIDPATRVISVPQADLSLISGTLWSLDSNQFRKDVWDILSSESHIWLPPAFTHNTEVTITGDTLARTIVFINGFSVTFEDTGSAYSIKIEGSNNNIHDIDGGILNPTALTTVIPTNSFGLITSPQILEIHQDAGLNADEPKTVTENTADTDYTETSTGITKTIVTTGSDTVITRT